VYRSICLFVLALAVTLGNAFAADVLVSGNSAAFGHGPISTYDVTTHTFVGSFVPDGAFGSNNGRGLALTKNEFFYTELTNGFGATDGIRVAPFNGGNGGADVGFFPNPIPGQGIADLAFGAEGLWVLAGYPSVGPRSSF
jgi:hypothetical protein